MNNTSTQLLREQLNSAIVDSDKNLLALEGVIGTYGPFEEYPCTSRDRAELAGYLAQRDREKEINQTLKQMENTLSW